MKHNGYNEVFGTNVSISSVDDEGDGGDRRIIDIPKPGAYNTFDLPKKSKKKKPKDKYSLKYIESLSFKSWLNETN